MKIERDAFKADNVVVGPLVKANCLGCEGCKGVCAAVLEMALLPDRVLASVRKG